MKKSKNIPAIVMLLGCAVAVIVTYIDGYSLLQMLKVLIIVLLLFLVIGLIIKFLFDKYIPPLEEETEEDVIGDEGAVIEKTSEEEIYTGESADAEAQEENTEAEEFSEQ